MGTLTEETLEALPVGSLVSFANQMTEDMFDSDGNLHRGYTLRELLVRTGEGFGRSFVSVHSASEFRSEALAELEDLRVDFTPET